MQSGVTVSCFFLSYVIVLALELSRLYLRMPWRMVVVLLMAILGLVTHAMFLWDRWAAVNRSVGPGALPATLFDWSLLAAWVLAAIYVFLAIRRPTNAIGPFLLPLVLAMILGALSVRSGQPFDRTASTGLWRYIHGGSLSLGTVAVTLGLATALMNLVQEYRLKTKRGMSGKLRLPSLEYLHTLGRSCLVVSTIAIACGLVSGVVLNFQRNGSVNWFESGIIFSGGLLIWLVIASILEWQAARRATSWSAYLNIASFLIVFLALFLVFAAPHGRTKTSASGKSEHSTDFFPPLIKNEPQALAALSNGQCFLRRLAPAAQDGVLPVRGSNIHFGEKIASG